MENINKIKEFVEDMHKAAKLDLKELSDMSMNAYGTGVEAGNVQAYGEILAFIDEFCNEEDNDGKCKNNSKT